MILYDHSTGRELLQLSGRGKVNAFAFSPDGKRLATSSYDIQVWDVPTGKEIWKAASPRMDFTMCAFSPDGERVVTSGGDWTVKVWNSRTGELVTTLGQSRHVFTKCLFSLDGAHLLALAPDGYQTCLAAWNLPEGKLLAERVYDAGIPGWDLSPDGTCVATGDVQGNIALWEPATLRRLALMPFAGQPAFEHVVFSPDGSLLLCTDHRGMVRVVDLPTRRVRCMIPFGAGVSNRGQASWNPDGATLTYWEVPALLHLENSPLPGAPVATAWQPLAVSRFLRKVSRLAPPGVLCPMCRRWVEVPQTALGAHATCPACAKPIKLNAIAVNADWRPVAQAWKIRG